MIDIKVPTVGESISEVTLLKWTKNDGDYVDRDEVIAELESEKATFEVNAEKAGLLKTTAKEGDTLKIGDTLASIDETAAKPEGKKEVIADTSRPATQDAPVAKTEEKKTIMDLRTKYKEVFNKKHAVNLGFMSFFTKAACFALKEWPSVNAYIDGDSIIYHDYCDISIAVSAARGLVVPVIRNAESLSMAEIERKVVELAGKARDNKLSMAEMQGGTFTITNGGVFG